MSNFIFIECFSLCCPSIYCIWCSIYCFCWLANGFHYSWMHRWLPIMCSGESLLNYTYSLHAINSTECFRYKNRPVMSGPGLYDPTSIMNAGELRVFISDFMGIIYTCLLHDFQTHFPNVNEKDGLNWLYTCYRSSIISTGKIYAYVLVSPYLPLVR